MNTRTILIVAGTAVGVFVLFKIMQPAAPVVAPKPKSNTDVLSLNALIGAGSALAGLFGGGSRGETNEGTYHADTSGFSISGNTLVDSSGNALTYGTDY